MSQSNKKITITDVAQHANVSVTTVSLVLSQKGRISAQTIARVQKAIDELGFVRNQTAANLRTQSTKTIGLMVNNKNDFSTYRMVAGISDVLEQNGYMLYLTQCGHSADVYDQKLLTLYQQGVEGIIMSPIDDQHLLSLRKPESFQIPLVCLSSAKLDSDIDYITPDNTHSAKLATEHLIRQGHRRIAYVGGTTGSPCRDERIASYRYTLSQYGLPSKQEWILDGNFISEDLVQAVNVLLTEQTQITAILCHDASSALSCINGVRKSGREIGKELFIDERVALISFDDSEQLMLNYPSLTCVYTDPYSVGESAALRLLDSIRNPSDSDHKSMLLPAKFIHRNSA